MQRNELVLAILLGLFILAGVAYESHRGAGKTAEITIIHPGSTPFDSTEPVTATNTLIQPDLSTETVLLLNFLNIAGKNQLKDIPGVGEVLSNRLLNQRQQLGKFTSKQQVLDTEGIGDSKLEQMLQYVQDRKNTRHFSREANTRHLIPVPFNSIKQSPNTQAGYGVKSSLNHATRSELMAVSGIGPTLADSILKARIQQRGFRNWDDVDAVSGIGEQRLQQLKNHFALP